MPAPQSGSLRKDSHDKGPVNIKTPTLHVISEDATSQGHSDIEADTTSASAQEKEYMRFTHEEVVALITKADPACQGVAHKFASYFMKRDILTQFITEEDLSAFVEEHTLNIVDRFCDLIPVAFANIGEKFETLLDIWTTTLFRV
jgi:hypothetical protein